MAASLGEITASEFWVSLGVKKEDVASVQNHYLDTYLKFNESFLDCVKVLSQKYRIAILSNDVGAWNEYLRNYYGFEKYIEKAFISSDLKCRKPDPNIYKIAINELGIEPWEGIFIDDSSERVEVAERIGLTGIVFAEEKREYLGLQVQTFSEIIHLCMPNMIK